MKNDWFEEHTKGLSPNEATDYSLWKSTKYLKRPKQHIPPIRNEDGSWAKSTLEKAAAFSRYFSEVFKPFLPDPQADDDDIINYLESPNQMSLPIKSFKPSEVTNVIRNEISSKKAPGYDLITGKILKELPRKGILLITFIFNAILRLEYFPLQWKVAQVIVIPKPGKPLNDVSSYRPISLLPVISKLFERLLLKRLQPVLEYSIPDHQFGFRRKHSTIQQVHRLVNVIRQTFEEKKYCSSAFLDVRQAFDKVWHNGLLYKLKQTLPHTFYNILKSYLSDRFFQIKLENTHTELISIESGVPQGSVLGPILYVIFTSDIPTSPETTTATFADDTAILSCHRDPVEASNQLQNNLNNIETWLKKWRIRVNETKSSQVVFSLRKNVCPQVRLNNILLPQAESVKYLGMHLDKKLTWKEHIWHKRQHLNLKASKLNWLIGKKSKLSTENKILLYKVILKPVWTYGIGLWGTASESNLEILQRFQSKVLRQILQAPWYVSNATIHKDVKLPTVKEEISRLSSLYQAKLDNSDNHLVINLMDNSEIIERLKRHSILDLPYRFCERR